MQSAKKHMLLEAWVVQLKARTDKFFWSSDELRAGSEKCNDGKTANGDVFRRSDGETSDIIKNW